MEYIISTLATYVLTLMFVESEGPNDAFFKLRSKYKVFRCFLCLSTWISAVIAVHISVNFFDWLLKALALTGAANIIHRYIDG